MPTKVFHLPSTSVAELRTVSVFLPGNFDAKKGCPIVFCGDGQAVEALSQRIEREIDEGKLPPIVIVGAHASQHRWHEYTLGEDDSRFRRHEQLFVAELPQWLLSEFGVKADRNRTALCGFSHGAAFALTMASRHRDLFGVVIAFSIAGTFEEYQVTDPSKELNPKFYLSAGTREKPLLKRTRLFAKHLRQSNIERIITERPAGHDFAFWDTELPLALKWSFQNH